MEKTKNKKEANRILNENKVKNLINLFILIPIEHYLIAGLADIGFYKIQIPNSVFGIEINYAFIPNSILNLVFTKF